MWKNFPLPPWGIALVKKNLCPSWEKSGASFCREEKKRRKTSARVYQVCIQKQACRAFSISSNILVRAQTHGANTACFFTNFFTTTGQCFSHLPVCATSSHSHPRVSENNNRVRVKGFSEGDIIDFSFCQQIIWKYPKQQCISRSLRTFRPP